MVHQNVFRLKLVTHIFLWVFGLGCNRQAFAQTQLIRDNQNHTVDFNGGDLVQEFLVPTDFSGRIYFEIFGADGGRKKNHADGTGIRAKGGQGARIGAWFNVSTEGNAIRPGSEILFIIGEHGDNLNGVFATGAGGGGGTAVFSKGPDNYYTMLMVAGGGQGGYADCCLVSNDGNPGSPYQCPWTETETYCFFEDLVTLRESCVQGGAAWSDASTAYLSGTLLNEDCWADGCEVYGKRGWPGGDYLSWSSLVKPTGGVGGTNSGGSDCFFNTLDPPDSDGGFGFGGGAAGTPFQGSGGPGGGLSGGVLLHPANSSSGGGGSVINPNLALTSPAQVKEKRSSTSDPQHGKVIYRIETLNNFPIAVCNNLTVNLNTVGAATVQAASLATGSSDLDGNNTLSFTVSKDGSSFASTLALACSNVPSLNVTVKVSDGSVTRQCTSTITVNDNTPPAVTCKPATLALNAGTATLTTAMVLNSVSDNCTASPTLSLSKTVFGCADAGNNTVTLTAKDSGNNTSICVAAVQVTNNLVSSFTCSPLTHYLDQNSLVYPSNFSPQLVYSCTTSDAISVLYQVGKESYGCQDVGVNPITLKAISTDGITRATCSTTITVVDRVPPSVTCRDITVDLYTTQAVEISSESLQLSASDDCGISSSVASKTSFGCSDVGSNTVTLTVTDPSGNAGFCTSTVWVVDHSLPSLSCDPQTVSLDPVGYANITPQSYNPQITYSCNSTASNTEVVYEVGKFDYDCQDLGTQPITLKLVSVDNPESTALATCSTTLTIVDQTPPQVTCKNITVELGNDLPVTISPLDVEESSSDNCGIATRVLSHKRFNCDAAGLRTIILTVTDYGGNTAYCASDVRIVDVVPPQAVCRDVTVQLFSDGVTTADPWYTGGLVSLSDNCSTTAFVAHTGPTFYSCEDVGTFEVALFVYDYEGNESLPCWHSVTVVDLIPPTARCLETKSVYIGDGAMYAFGPDDIDNGSSDACGLAGSETDIQLFTCDDVGVQTVTLTVTDVNGNSSTCTTTVYVEDVVPPTLACQNAAVNFNGESALTPAPENLAQVMDNCSNLEWSMDPPEITCDAIGQVVPVAVTVTDLSSLSATCISYVTVSGLPCGWVDTPEGIDCPGGNAVAYDPLTGTFTLTANGCFGPGASTDQSSYSGYALCGDGTITAHIAGLTLPGRAGIVMRESAAPGAKKVEMSYKGINPLAWSVRYDTDSDSYNSSFQGYGSRWLRLVRTGNQITGYFSADGQTWSNAFSVSVSMANCIEVGIFAEQTNPVNAVTATFDHVVIDSPSGSVLPKIANTAATQTASALDPVGMDLWPNPTSGIVTLELTGAWADAGNDALDIAVFDSFGRPIRSIQPGAFSDPVITLDLKGQPPGLYLVRVKDTKGAIIVQRLVLTDR